MNIGKGKSRFLLVMLLAGFAFGTSSAFAAIDQGAVDKCKACHEDEVTNFVKGTHHGKVFAAGDKQNSCESCHGPGEKHIAAGGSKDTIIGFGKKSEQSVEEQSKQCLSCHAKNKSVAMWDIGKHKKNDVSCASCHSTHVEKDMKAPENCFSCHKDVKAQAKRFSHHPIIEGKVSCSDCHNPHGTTSHGMIKAENNNQLCYKCHADKRGPFVWEHAPVEENCNNCHVPHGSQNMKLLTRRAPYLCNDCHSANHSAGTTLDATNGFKGTAPTNKTFARGCINCHNKIHGSVAPANTNDKYMSGQYFVR
ncbi:MAG: hypothetical protein A2Z97_01960 [Bdellovibrionales bacterium GWB1_52_6]|nr:MAG: hypothetical protein A2Z97_01960 [Bdellovibrionales bacterium GWB1_52_6]OFZ04536.1 MAG: hypothetical protein A2X97_12995 [Bdellovibrionales bacterium GWA1_52_35]HCM39942.1 hypothetical protein [Bdellovibrionales bacterium]